MDEAVNDTSWLRDEHRMILYALVSLAVVVGGHRGWQEYHKYQENAHRRARILKLVENSKRENNVASTSQNHLALPVDETKILMRSDTIEGRDRSVGRILSNGKPDVGGPSTSTSTVTAGSNAKRSKERKKRGRDSFRDTSKQDNNNNARTSSNSRSVGPGGGTGNQSQQQVAGPSGSSSTSANAASISTESRKRGRQQNKTDGASRTRISNTCVEAEKHEDEVDTPRPNASSTMTSVSARSDDIPRDEDRDAYIDASDSYSSNNANMIECAGTQNERGHDYAVDPEDKNESNNDLLHPPKKHYTVLPSQPPEVYNNYPRSRSKKRKAKDSANSLAGRSHFSTPSPSPSPSPSARLVPLPDSRPGSSLGGGGERDDSSSSVGMRSRASSIIERDFGSREYETNTRERRERNGRERDTDRDTERFRLAPTGLTTSISTPHHLQLNPGQSEFGMVSPSAVNPSSMWPPSLPPALGQNLSMMSSMPVRENGHGNKGQKGESGREKGQHLKSVSSTSASTSASSSLAGSVSDAGSWDWDTGSSSLSMNGAGNSSTHPNNGSATINGPGMKNYSPPRFRSKTREVVSASPLPTLSSLANGVGSPNNVDSAKFNGNISATNSPETILFPTLNPTPPPNASLTTQIASYKGALEAARIREESYRAEVEHFKTETERLNGEQDVIKWQWNEADKEWKRREAELQSHIHRLMHQLHGMSFVSGVTPPAHLPPNSMGAAAHPPMVPFVPVPLQLHNNNNNDHRSPHRTRSHHRQHHPQVYHSTAGVPSVLGSPFGYPSSAPASASFYAHYQMPTPLTSMMMSMTGSGHIPRPGSTSTSHSSSNSASNSPSHHGGEVFQDNLYYDHQQENGLTANIEEEDINEQLAEAILKRPDSLRSPGSSSSVGSFTSGSSKNSLNGGGFSAWMANGAGKMAANGNGIGIASEIAMKNGLPSSSNVSLGSESDRTPVSGVQAGNSNEAFPNQDEREEDQHFNEDKEKCHYNDIHENPDKSMIKINGHSACHNEKSTNEYLLEDSNHSIQNINGDYCQVDDEKVDEVEYTSTQRE